MEEGIKIVEEILDGLKANRVHGQFTEEQFMKENQAIEQLIKGYKKQEKYINKLENKLMYALSPTSHELALTTQEHFKTIIRDNLDEDTYTIKRALKEYWKNI